MKPFYMGEKEFLAEEIWKVGFWSVKTFYAPMNPMIRNVTDYKNLLLKHWFDQIYNEFDEETKIKFDQELEKEFESLYGSETTKIMEFEILFAVAIK